MKLLFALVFVFSNAAFAVDYECTNKPNKDRTEHARVSTWPNLSVQLSVVECTDAGNGTSICSGSGELLGSDYGICYQTMDVKKDCFIVEGNTVDDNEVVVSCKNGVALNLEIGRAGKGHIICSTNGHINKMWDVGACIKK